MQFAYRHARPGSSRPSSSCSQVPLRCPPLRGTGRPRHTRRARAARGGTSSRTFWTTRTFCACQARQAYWLHLALRCRTLTCSWRSDEWDTVRRLRGDARPEGFGDPETESTNELARRAAFLSRVVGEEGGYFTTETPRGLRVWDMRFMRAPPELKPLRLVCWDASGRARCTRSRQVP